MSRESVRSAIGRNRFASFLLAVTLGSIPCRDEASAAVTQLFSPVDFTGTPALIDFDQHPSFTIANSLYQGQGITFSRDDQEAVLISDWAILGRSTATPPNVLSTILHSPLVNSYVTHLNAHSATPLQSLGAFFGNDQQLPSFPADAFTAMRLTAYDALDQAIGAVVVQVNANIAVDQFIGISSDVPFSRVRFQNLSGSGNPATTYAVAIDAMLYIQIPEPTVSSLAGMGILPLLSCRLRRNSRSLP